MICPECNSNLKCINSRQLDNNFRQREYACFKCEIIYNSEEKLILKVIRKWIPKRFKTISGEIK